MPNDDGGPRFREFNARAPVRIYWRNLPHWRQAGCTYFVTFRLGDSVPKHVLQGWQDDDRVWLKAHGIDGLPTPAQWQALPTKERRRFERRAARRLHVELDACHGSCLLREPAARRLLHDAILHFHGTRWWVGDFVIMPNHVHGLLLPCPDHELEDVLGSVKGFVSTRLTKLGLKSGSLWQQENYDHIVRDRAQLAALRRYIERNPGRANLQASEFTYYRAGWLDPK